MKPRLENDDFQSVAQRYRDRVDAALDAALPAAEGEADRLKAAMRYSVQNGGKRIRPILLYATTELFGPLNSMCDSAACALELVHAYSLVHDDLPAMDDDDLRRGKPTCHIAFDEATAILVGDALQCLAFEQLTAIEGNAEVALALVRLLSQAAGWQGMVSGQAVDLYAVNQQLSVDQLQRMHQLKTGALIQASILMGATIGCANNGGISENHLAALTRYSQAIGLAFQVQDDILDVTSTTEQMGKRQGSDQHNNKPTYTALLGVDGAKQQLAQLHRDATEALAVFANAAPLHLIADYIVARTH